LKKLISFTVGEKERKREKKDFKQQRNRVDKVILRKNEKD
jgi:hypothetical protein